MHTTIAAAVEFNFSEGILRAMLPSPVVAIRIEAP